jgi:hypothetical protein
VVIYILFVSCDSRLVKLVFFLSVRLVVAHKTGVSLMEIRDEEEQGGSTGSNENSLPATNLEIQS